RAALALVQPMSPGRQRNPLSPNWKALRSRLQSPGLGFSLSRLLHFCSARGVEPDAICGDTFQDFRLFLSNTLSEAPEKIFIRTAKAWRTAQAGVPEWPRLAVEVPNRRKNWTLGWERFPASLKLDFETWRDRLAGVDILDEMPFRPVRRRTLDTREWQV